MDTSQLRIVLTLLSRHASIISRANRPVTRLRLAGVAPGCFLRNSALKNLRQPRAGREAAFAAGQWFCCLFQNLLKRSGLLNCRAVALYSVLFTRSSQGWQRTHLWTEGAAEPFSCVMQAARTSMRLPPTQAPSLHVWVGIGAAAPKRGQARPFPWLCSIVAGQVVRSSCEVTLGPQLK